MKSIKTEIWFDKGTGKFWAKLKMYKGRIKQTDILLSHVHLEDMTREISILTNLYWSI